MEPMLNQKQSNFPNSTNQNSTQATTKQAGKQNREMFVCLDNYELEKVTGSGGSGLKYYAGLAFLQSVDPDDDSTLILPTD
ncbi:hypothetical protein [Dapis sp. BLCC M229]|uniref:hypothetical protein n=1 Tax=Dapis sp. BLCC M229 TaxID=3400188 RepID=UPI003CEE54D6